MSNLVTTTVSPKPPVVEYEDNGDPYITLGNVRVNTYVHVPIDGGEPYVVVQVEHPNDDGDADPIKVYVNDGVVHDASRAIWRDRNGDLWERDPLYFDGRWILSITLQRVREQGSESGATGVVYRRDEVGLTFEQLETDWGPLERA